LDRDPELSKDSANGNDLIVHWEKVFPGYDAYFQLFVTSPFLRESTIKKCYDTLKHDQSYDSVTTVFEETGFYWMDNNPINYNPRVLPGTQDCKKIINETTAIYGIRSETLRALRCRLGNSPAFVNVSHIESIDIDTYSDFIMAEYIASSSRLSYDEYIKVINGEESKNIAVDFDGVIHNNNKGFFDGTVYGKPISGAVELYHIYPKTSMLLFILARLSLTDH
jgi:hypothetical protein